MLKEAWEQGGGLEHKGSVAACDSGAAGAWVEALGASAWRLGASPVRVPVGR